MLTLHVPVPVHPAPDQPENVEVASAAAVNTTDVPYAMGAEHVAPQSMPAGADVTVPAPLPSFVTVRVSSSTANVAVTETAADIVTVHVEPLPLQPPPLHPLNVEPTYGVAVNVTLVPAASGAEHVAPQSIPAGLEVTLPLPSPAFTTVRVKGPGGVPVSAPPASEPPPFAASTVSDPASVDSEASLPPQPEAKRRRVEAAASTLHEALDVIASFLLRVSTRKA
jgi:hypothetical protein